MLQDFVYPENVAYPVGGPGNARFLVMEIHYDNPESHRGKLGDRVLNSWELNKQLTIDVVKYVNVANWEIYTIQSFAETYNNTLSQSASVLLRSPSMY